jgi:hypothetical protein
VHPHPATDASWENLEELFLIYLPTSSEREKARRLDSVYCTGVFFTAIPTDKMMLFGRWMAWVFFWDDEIDCELLRHSAE